MEKMNEKNVEVMLKVVLSLLTEEQLEKLKVIMDKIEFENGMNSADSKQAHVEGYKKALAMKNE